MDLKNKPGKIYVGAWNETEKQDKVNVVFKMKENDFFDLLDQKLDYVKAFAQGKIKFNGNLLAMNSFISKFINKYYF